MTATSAHNSYREGSFTVTTSIWFWVESVKPHYSRVSSCLPKWETERGRYSQYNIETNDSQSGFHRISFGAEWEITE